MESIRPSFGLRLRDRVFRKSLEGDINILMLIPMVLAALPQSSGSSATAAVPVLDYTFFKERVQPIFLKKRPGHARCIVCHESGSLVPHLQELSPGATAWNEEQSQKNFEAWKAFVVPGKPAESPMLLHPLAREAGGDHFHAGGKHWKSQADPEWQTLAAWVMGKTTGGSN